MDISKMSVKGRELIQMYETMVKDGYERTDETHVENAFSSFELRPYREKIKPFFEKYGVSSVLDYGCGGSDWEKDGFDEVSGQSAVQYFKLKKAFRYEPSRDIDERQKVDCVVSFDVLEHVFIADVANVLRDMLSYASKLVVLNVACYPAAAKLPNGENAHITVRPPHWWKGMIDGIAVEYPSVPICLICSSGWRKSNAFAVWSANDWLESETFVVNV